MPTVRNSLAYYLTIGLLQALAMVVALHYEWPGLLVAASVLGINLQLLGRRTRDYGVWLGAGLLALLLGAVSAWVFTARPDGGSQSLNWIVSAHVVAYVGITFVLGWQPADGVRLRYEALFRYAWNNIFILLLACLLTGLFWGLLQLCGSLFRMIGVNAFAHLFDIAEFNIVSLALVFSLGMRIGCENERIIGTLRSILLSLCRFLAPMAAAIVVMFSVALPFTGLAPIWDTGHATTILLCLVASNLFLVNGVFQDGNQPRAYPAWVLRLIDASLVMLPLLVALAGYSTWLRIGQYGLSPSRFNALLMVAIAGCHSLAALTAVLRRGQGWLATLRVTNPWLALLLCILLVLIHTPWLNPQAMSARNQIERLLDGRTSPARFDAAYLYSRLGEPGRQALEDLGTRLDGIEQLTPEARQLIKVRMEDAKGRSWTRPFAEQSMVWIGAPVDGHEQFSQPTLGVIPCDRLQCMMWAVDLDNDGLDEVVQFSPNRSPMHFFRRDTDGRWLRAGEISGWSGVGQLDDMIRAGKVRVVEPRYRNLEIDGKLYISEPESPR